MAKSDQEDDAAHVEMSFDDLNERILDSANFDDDVIALSRRRFQVGS